MVSRVLDFVSFRGILRSDLHILNFGALTIKEHRNDVTKCRTMLQTQHRPCDVY